MPIPTRRGSASWLLGHGNRLATDVGPARTGPRKAGQDRVTRERHEHRGPAAGAAHLDDGSGDTADLGEDGTPDRAVVITSGGSPGPRSGGVSGSYDVDDVPDSGQPESNHQQQAREDHGRLCRDGTAVRP